MKWVYVHYVSFHGTMNCPLTEFSVFGIKLTLAVYQIARKLQDMKLLLEGRIVEQDPHWDGERDVLNQKIEEIIPRNILPIP